MKVRRLALYAGCVFQLLRFVPLSGFVLLAVHPANSPAFALSLLWPATAQFTVAAGFFFMAVRPERYGPYGNLLILAKFLDAAPGVVLLASQVVSIYFGLGTPVHLQVAALELVAGTPLHAAALFYYVLVGTVLLDLIFLFVLISLRPSARDAARESTGSAEGEAPEGPDHFGERPSGTATDVRGTSPNREPAGADRLPELSEVELEDE